MKSFAVLALLGALASAAPMNKRDVVWVTEYATDVVTVQMTQTVWVDWAAKTKQANFRSKKASRTVGLTSTAVISTSTATSVVESSSAAPTIESTSSVYVAPTTSTSEYVAPATTSSSEYVAPTTSSTSEYVAPTTTSTLEYVTPTVESTTSVYVAPTTSSVYVAPTTSSSSVYVAPTLPSTTSVYVAPTTSSAAPAATSSAASSGSGVTGSAASGTSYSGDLTWYETGLGSCGISSTSSDHIVAISHVIMDAYNPGNPNNNPLCGKTITITGKDGADHVATVVDRCPGCAQGDLDLSLDFFNLVTSNGDGRVGGMKWKWN